jgi:hypothetical protein
MSSCTDHITVYHLERMKMVRLFSMYVFDSIQETWQFSSIAAYKQHEYKHASIAQSLPGQVRKLYTYFSIHPDKHLLLQGGLHSCGSDVQLTYTLRCSYSCVVLANRRLNSASLVGNDEISYS